MIYVCNEWDFRWISYTGLSKTSWCELPRGYVVLSTFTGYLMLGHRFLEALGEWRSLNGCQEDARDEAWEKWRFDSENQKKIIKTLPFFRTSSREHSFPDSLRCKHQKCLCFWHFHFLWTNFVIFCCFFIIIWRNLFFKR